MTTPEHSVGQPPSRSSALILAGGGLKVAFQAGVLQVWLDEARLTFDLADGASGGCFNLAMYCQGMSGKKIADNWRTLDPASGVSLNVMQFARLFFARSLFTMDAYRGKVFPKWGLDWNKIRASSVAGTFNLYNFSKHRLEIAAPGQMDEDHLCAAVALPMFFPPVVLNGDTYIDPVYVTDGNLEEAIRRGADELWVIWTVSQRGEWDDGFVNNYFQIIEATANGRLRQIEDRIAANNDAIAGGKNGEFGRPIVLKMLQAEVELNYLVDFSADRMAEAVNQGVQTAREWCKKQGIPFSPLPETAPEPVVKSITSLQFTEEMKGFLTLGEVDYDKGFRLGQAHGTDAMVHLTIKVENVDEFITDPQHVASATGFFKGALFGGQRVVNQGIFNLFVDDGDPERKAMYYRLFFSDEKGNPLTLLGFKDVRGGDGSDVWTDTTTLFTRILKGHVGPEADGGADILAAGIIRIHFLDFLKELTTFRTEGPDFVGARPRDAAIRFALPEQAMGRLRAPRLAGFTVLTVQALAGRSQAQRAEARPISHTEPGDRLMPFDVIIIGSGFGGAITACRLSQAGYRVLVLERGRRWDKTNFPRKPEDRWLWNHDRPEAENGWLDLRMYPGMSIAAGAAVGGGSLIYANISCEAPPAIFEAGWCPEINYQELKPHYDTVAGFMDVQPVPDTQWTGRMKLMRDAAVAAGFGDRFKKLDLAVSFDPNWTYAADYAKGEAGSTSFTNKHGAQQGTCVHLANCDIGCDVHAKNTLDRNYLYVAENQFHADIRPLQSSRPDRAGFGRGVPRLV